jgi:hypothetical protein
MNAPHPYGKEKAMQAGTAKRFLSTVRPEDKSFEFKDAIGVMKATGRKASTLGELREGIAAVSEESIFNHTYQYFMKGFPTEYTSDFAEWVGRELEEGALAEHLSNIDFFNFGSIGELRTGILAVMDEYIANFPEPRPALPGNEFYFTETMTFVFPAGLKARNLAEFYMALKYIDQTSIYYHFLEAKARLGKGEDDFSKWLDEVMGVTTAVERIRQIDPFMFSIESIREQLVHVIEDELKAQMEVV